MFQLCFLYFILSIQGIVSINDEFICPKDGRWPHPSDCEKYYTCNSGIYIEGWCGSDMTYDPDHHRCDLSQNIECKDGERPSWTPPEGWGHGKSVASYVVTKTTANSHNDDDDDDDNGDVKLKVRGSRRRKNTHRLTTVSTRWTGNQVTLSIFELVEDNYCAFKGNMPDPDNCQFYYTCKENVITHIHCPERQLFDENIRICSDYRKVFCVNRPTNEHEKDPCIGQQNGWYGDSQNQCRSYYLCTEQRKTKIRDCPLGSKWNSQRLRCDDPRNIVSPCGFHNNHGVSLFPRHHSMIAMTFSISIFFLTC